MTLDEAEARIVSEWDNHRGEYHPEAQVNRFHVHAFLAGMEAASDIIATNMGATSCSIDEASAELRKDLP